MANSDDDDVFTIVMMGLGSIGAILAFAATLAATMWTTTITWLLDHDVLVSAAKSPWLSVPNSDGVGLDAQRCFIAAGLLLLLVVAAVDAIRRYWARGRDLG